MAVNYEKKQLEYNIGSYSNSSYNNTNLNELKKVIEDFEKRGATHFYMEGDFNDGVIEDISIDFIKFEEETDAEYKL
jgi:hypothetical protein